jgi:hypothetical protein
MKPIGFDREYEGESKPKIDFESYRDSWVLIGDGDPFAGRVYDINLGGVYLMPYYATKPENGRQVHKIVREGLPFRIPLNERTKIRPTTEEEEKENAVIWNTQEQRRLLLEELDFRMKIRSLHLDGTFTDGSGI